MTSRSFLQVFPLELVHQIIDELCHGVIQPPCTTCCGTICECPPWDYNAFALLSYFLLAPVHTLIDRPDLGKLVKRLCVDETAPGEDEVPKEVMEYIVEKVSTHHAKLGADRLSREAFMEDFFPDEDYRVRPEVVSSCCPNLETLAVDEGFTNWDVWTWTTASSEGDEIGSHNPWVTEFPNLKTLKARHGEIGGGRLDLAGFYWVLRAAATTLQSIRLQYFDSYALSDEHRTEPDGAVTDGRLANVTRLRIDDSAINALGFFDILQLFPNLQELRYKGYPNPYEQFGPQDAADAIFRLLDLNIEGSTAGASDGASSGGMKHLKRFDPYLHDDREPWRMWPLAEIQGVERAFADRGIQFSYKA